MEHAAMYAVAADLPEGSTTVGASMGDDARQAVGRRGVIAAEAELRGDGGTRLTFR